MSRSLPTHAKVSRQVDPFDQSSLSCLRLSLLPEHDAKVGKLLQKWGVISRCGHQRVCDKDLRLLCLGQWLNDKIINFYGEMSMRHAEEAKKNKQGNVLDVQYFSSFFWTKLSEQGYHAGGLASWTQTHNMFSKDIVLISVHHSNRHWTAAAINFRKKRIKSYDSLNHDRTQVFTLLRGYLNNEHRHQKGWPFDFTSWVDWTPKDTLQQENTSDCGVFTCQFLQTLSRSEEEFAFTQADMPYLRR
ncbi:uncharacterized protein PHACADRAFT_89513 [Phanerochaete carnosa HHB-10118-sp]|uniref:Ubiquitin-like protease family profile domain-containing protein n=1 Tax=Phanerochaete carnosa (strain HHB-10118-sp) TaxID=650164 RepID=K5WEE3_PHACS|nr:uncharacterized protein PHACADRAFT_89513 [Phanerochaete carnosa HHB-10118-sp]EKM57429.1 hypothetical protein PHACADRAFT_89513 [Phanerochaete carnosa HHB-10118-sp]